MINYNINPNDSLIVASILFIPIVVASLFISKFATYPFVKIFAKLSDDSDNIKNAIGKICTITLPATATSIGQADVSEDGTVLKINILSGSVPLVKGEKGLVINYNKDHNQYIVEPYNNL